MTFDLEKYEDAIMSQDDVQRTNAGLELAETVSHLDRETLERFSQPLVDLLLKSLRKTDWEFRSLISNALLILGKLDFVAKSTWFWKKLISTYTDVDAGLRSSAMDLLKELGRSEYSLEILEPLIEGLRNSDKDMRILSANTLALIRAREVLPMLLEALHDENANVVYSVAESLGDIGDARAVPALMELLVTHSDEWVHVATLEALGKIGDQRVVDLLLSLVKKEVVVDPLINALGVLGDSRAIPVLAQYLKEEDRETRELAVKALVTIWEEVENIASFTGVRYELDETRQLLQRALTPKIKNTLLQDVQNDSLNEDIREGSAVLLSCIGYQNALVPTVGLLEKFPLSKRVLYAIGQYEKRAFPAVIAFHHHSNDLIRQSVAVYLQQLATRIDGYDSQLEQSLLQLLDDENPVLNHLAFDALASLKSSALLSPCLDLLKRRPEELGERIVALLATLPKRSLSRAILEKMETEDEISLPYMLELLGYAGEPVETFKKFFKHANPQVQEASILAIGYTGNAAGIPLLLPFIMSRQNSLARCAAAQSLQRLIEALGTGVSSPRNVFDALFVMLNTYRNEEELALVAQAMSTLCRYRYPDISEVNLAVVRGRFLDLVPIVSNETKIELLHALHSLIDMSSFETIREFRRFSPRELQEMVASLYSQFDSELRVLADVADMISHAEYAFRKYWILAAGNLSATELTDMIVPLLAEPDFRAEAFQALVRMGKAVLPRLGKWLDHEDPRIQKMIALVLSRISQDNIDKFCKVALHSKRRR
ncbi:PBS lyase HEAT-like repeat protein [Candidatus Moduliflexus flocculans]|uniref:PBS lyase HEAT-like repeat protein n=1 Tax=Candidatus Moduliflexus flocculans TaxID=1499966 RepID=A0A081BRX9_9BACT|nr:PBS lyase HEAT-like repeat protein [Candidatus Moduliflexus flocculans]